MCQCIDADADFEEVAEKSISHAAAIGCSLMRCMYPITIYQNKLPYVVPCKRCIPCKINKTSEWVLRILMELKEQEKAIFLTLTYNDENLPAGGSLNKEDWQAFIKALRQRYPDRKLMYFMCGEYGETSKRCHYHAIIFGMGNSLEERIDLYESWKKCDSYQFFGKTWFKTVGEVTADSAAYVAGYCQKKLFGSMAKVEYGDKQPPFQLQSQKIGEKYFLKNKEKFCEDGFISYNGRQCPIPETWKRKFDLHFTERQAQMDVKIWSDFISYVNEHKDKMYRLFKGRTLSDLQLQAFQAGYQSFRPQNLCKYPGQDQAYINFVKEKNNLSRKREL